MKLPRILVLAGLAASILGTAATPAAAQTNFYWGPQSHGYMYTHYIGGVVVSTQFMGCDGWESWDGYNGYPDLTVGETADYIDWEC